MLDIKITSPIVLFLSGFLLVSAQNLVLNPSFEQHKDCPKNFSDFASNVTLWSTPTIASTDYFNSCSDRMGVPKNLIGHQRAIFGQSYAGIYAYSVNDYREYIIGNLREPLKDSLYYEVSVYVSLAEKSHYSVKNFGILTSRESFKLKSKKNLKCQFESMKDNFVQYVPFEITEFVSNKEKWARLKVKIKGAGERFIIFGNFETNAETAKKLEKNPENSPFSYYYVDMVKVIPLAPEPIIKDISTEAFHPIIGKKYVLKNVFFEFDKDSLVSISKDEIGLWSSYLKENPGLTILVEGHTDNIGSEIHNQLLSENRAKKVATYLKDLGIDTSRIACKGYGSDAPCAPNSNSKDRQLNRRVEVTLIQN